MSEGRDSYHHGELQEALLDVATAHVRRDGAHALSLRAVAREVGVDIAAVYRHFKGKDDLLLAVARRGFAALADRTGDALAGAASPREHVRALVHAYVGLARDEPELFRLMVGPWCAGEHLMMTTPGARHPAAHALVERVMQEIEPEERGLSSAVALTSIWAVAQGLATILLDSGKELGEAKLEGTVDVLVRGLGLD